MATFTFSEVATVNTGDAWVGGEALWASGFGLWLLVGAPTVASTSGLQTAPDRTTWTMRTMPSSDVYRSIDYAPTLGTIGRAVAVGSGAAAWSDDGITWAAATVLPETNNWTDVKWWAEKSLWIACAANGVNRMMSSTDGKTWVAVAAASALVWSGLAVSPTVAVCVAYDTSVGTQLVQTSADGAAWVLQTHDSIKTNIGIIGGIGNRIGVGYSADLDQFLITGTTAGNVTKAYRSTDDGVTWTASGVIPTIAFSLNRGYLWLASLALWYMPTEGWNYGMSADGDTWTIGSIPFSINWAGYTAIDSDGASYLLSGSMTGGHDVALVVAITEPTAITPARGTSAGGTVVMLTGVGLGSVTSVTFDGVAATDVVPAADGLSLTCITPAHAVGAVDVVVTGIGTLAAAYTYVTVTRVTPNTGTVFGATPVTITGYGFDLATGVTFDGLTLTSIVYVSNTLITGVTPQHASGSVDVVVLGVDTLAAGYAYEISADLLPPFPYYSPLEEGGDQLISGPWAGWLRTVKQRIEEWSSAQVPAELIIGVLSAANIPQLPFTRLTMESPFLLGRSSDGEGPAEQIAIAGSLRLTGGVLSGTGGSPAQMLARVFLGT